MIQKSQTPGNPLPRWLECPLAEPYLDGDGMTGHRLSHGGKTMLLSVKAENLFALQHMVMASFPR